MPRWVAVRFRTILVAVAITALGIGLLGAYLFRHETSHHKVIGDFTYFYSWGYIHEIALDVNRDGIPEAFYTVAPDSRRVMNHFYILGGKESIDMDGVFTLHFRRFKDTDEFITELDLSCPGSRVKVFKGKDSLQLAKEYYKEMKSHEHLPPA